MTCLACSSRLRLVAWSLRFTTCFYGVLLALFSFTAHAQSSTTLCAGSSVNLGSLITVPGGSTVSWSQKPQATAIAAGRNHSLALLTNSSIVGWGFNGNGQTSIPASATPAMAISAGGAHSLALLANGSIVGWGDSSDGQITIPSSATPATALAVGNTYSLALLANGSIVGWGSNAFGRASAPASATPATAIAAGFTHSLALKVNSSIVGWGFNGDGQTSVPASATPAMAISAGAFHSLALLANGSIVGWGDNNDGQITIPASATPATAIVAANFHSLALLVNGSVVGWGSNGSGESTAPPLATGATAIAAGDFHSLALLANGSVVGWGSNSFGQSAGYDAQPLTSATVSPTATQTYYYVIRNANGSRTTGSVEVTVNQLVAFTQQPPASSQVCTGANVSAPVSVSGTVTGYQWYKGSTPVAGQTTATLNLTNVQPTDTGSYSVAVTGACNSVNSTAFALAVSNFSPTVIITLPNGSTVNVAGNLPTITLPPNGPSVLQASGGVSYERLIIVDRINGYEIRQVDSNTTGIFPINRTGLFTLTVTGAGGCSRTVQGVVQ